VRDGRHHREAPVFAAYKAAIDALQA
jgi:hypothetical protein